ncbi:MAG: hypothetical protein B7X00_00620, partial [Legionella sp. 21-45-4]
MIQLLGLLLSVLSSVVFADGSSFSTSNISFTPPPGDVSVGFLGNLFGVVDGVLYGTGSQILSTMFAVFNSGVLALGGIVVLYVILVSTLNTAHEGEMLRHKWSSIWIPVRMTMGLALLIPKASGYCLMQIFVMWVIVQGVGLADKVWDAALGYLNRGGVLVHANQAPQLSTNSGQGAIADGAANVLYAEVCMYALQTQLENLRNTYLDQLNNGNTGPCAGTPSTTMQNFCNNPVPDFISSVNPISATTTGTNPYNVPMPNFSSGSDYAALNGICGQLQWNVVSTSAYSGYGLSSEQEQVISSSRSLAVSQLYTTLSLLAQNVVNNDPQVNTNANPGGASQANPAAVLQYGVLYTGEYAQCTSPSQQCPNWGADTSMIGIPVLLQGMEFLNALNAYNAVMAPILNLQEQADAQALAEN